MKKQNIICHPRLLGAAVFAAGVAMLVLIQTVPAQETGRSVLTEGTFEGSPSLVFSNGALALTVLPQGATMASLVMLDDSERLNPLWNSVRVKREQGREAAPTSMTGHPVCVDGFGPMSPEERQAGMPFNGEAVSQSYEVDSQKKGTTAEVTMTATLPIVQESLTRIYRMVDGESVVYVESRLRNLMGFDRPVNWGEHATVGAPFVEPGVTVFDLSGLRSRTTDYAPDGRMSSQRTLAAGQVFDWPSAPARDGGLVDMRRTPARPEYTDHTTTLMDPSRELEWVTALNPKRKLILGYLFRREDYPWMQTWTTSAPLRGLEFATQPFSASRRDVVTLGTMFDTPTYRWLPAESEITTHFLVFYTRIPEGFTKVDDVRLENGGIIIEDHAAKHQVWLAASLKPW